MKKTWNCLVFAVLLVIQAGAVWATTQAVTFKLSAVFMAPLGLNIAASSVSIPGNIYGPASSPLSFNPLTLKTNGTYQWFAPDHYFVIFVAPTGGAPNPDVVATFTEGTSPSSTVKLGHRTNITFVKVTPSNSEITIVAKQLQHNLVANPVHIVPSQIGTGNYLKIYVGVNDGLGGFTGFTMGDPPGTYNGTLVITATQ